MNENIENTPMQETDELLAMKQQVKALQAELDKQTTLREDSIKRLLGKRSHSFRNRELASIILVAVVAFGMPPYLYFLMHTSIWFSLFTFAFFLFGLGWELTIWRRFHLNNMMELDLLTTAKNMQEYRKLNRIWLYQIGLPFIAVWGTWFLYEVIGNMALPEDGHSRMLVIGCFIACIAFGGTIGGLIGYFSFYKPQMKLAQDMIEQIREIENVDNNE